jgi:hypothetical protein
MSNLSHLPRRELERLSAYLDGALSSKETSRLEARLQADPALQRALEELRQTANLLHSLPEVPLPRSFTLTAQMVGKRARPPAYPVLRLATVLVALAFVVLVGIDAFTSMLLPAASVPSAVEQYALEVAAPEDMAQKAVEAPEEAPAMEEADQFFAEPELAGAGEEQAIPGEAEGAFRFNAATPPASLEVLPTPDLKGEMAEAEAPLPAGPVTMTAEVTLEMELGATHTITPEPTALPTPSITPQPAPVPTPGLATRADKPVLSSLRVLEIGLGLATLLLAGLTLRAWRRRH